MTLRQSNSRTLQNKQSLIKKALDRRSARSLLNTKGLDTAASNTVGLGEKVQESSFDPTDFVQFSSHRQVLLHKTAAEQMELQNPYFKSHEGVACNTTVIDGRTYFNFSSYNYLGLNADPRILTAAKEAIDCYGVSSSASRLVSGERPVQRELECELAKFHGVDDAVLFVSGHATNVTVIGHLFGPKDLVLHDSLIHNSIIEGAKLSGATRLSFPHNDWNELDKILEQCRADFERVLIVVEALYSMNGDYPDLVKMVEVKNKHKALLMVDEAHSIGVMGESGRGIAEHFSVDPQSVDIWMGTLSKTFASCGGYIAGSQALIDILKGGAPGFLYSVGIAPVLAASALAALNVMLAEPERVRQLRQNSKMFDDLARSKGIDTGSNRKLAIIPVMTKGSVQAVRLSGLLFDRGINVQPIIYPAVEERLSRLRFFISCTHTEQQITQTVDHLAAAISSIEFDKND